MVGALARAAARDDYATICDDLLAPEVRRRAGGDACPALLRRSAAGVSGQRLAIQSVVVRGDRARVRVRTRSADEAPAAAVIELERRAGSFRVTALAE